MQQLPPPQSVVLLLKIPLSVHDLTHGHLGEDSFRKQSNGAIFLSALSQQSLPFPCSLSLKQHHC